MEQKPAVTDVPPAKSSEAQRAGCRSLLGPITSILLALFILVCVAGIIVVRVRAESLGFDTANVGTFLLTLFALIALVPLILLRTRVALFQRLMGVAAVVLVTCAPFLTLRIDGFDGRLVPIVRWRWVPKPPPLENTPTIASDVAAVDLVTRTPDDFPQFLGPDRNLDLPEVYIESDWKKYPPELLWRRPIGAGWSSFSAVNGYAVTLEQRGAEEVVICYSIETGEVMWAHGHEARHETVMGGLGPRSTPTIDEGLVYTLGATGWLRCNDGATGNLVWSDDVLQRCNATVEEDLSAVPWGRAASPLVAGDLLIVPLGGPKGSRHSLIAYDKKSGDVRWRGGDRQVSYASPSLVTLGGIQQILIVNERSVSGHRLEDGSVIWLHEWIGHSNEEANCSQAVALSDNRVLLTNRREAALLQLVPGDEGLLQAELVWPARTGRSKLKTKFTNVLVREGFAYGLSDGILECVEVASGKRRWKNRRGDYGHGQILGVGDVILIQAESGEVVLVEINPDELVELARCDALSERTWNTPCLYGSRLLVRNAAEAACFRLKLRDTEKP